MKSSLMEFEAVVTVSRHKSFRAAASDLGMSTSALSHAVAALESRIGARLFNRTTRSVSLSEAGEEFVASVSPALSAIRSAIELASSHHHAPVGTLRINTSAGAARQIMTPIIVEYLRRHPKVRVDVVTEGRLIDIVLEGFDAGIRLAELVPKDMIAVPFGPNQRMMIVGSPAYFAKNPVPRSPADLSAHRCIRIRLPSGAMYRWEFERRGESITVEVDGALTLDDPMLTLEAARSGLGLAYMSEWNVSTDLAAGTLRCVLEDWTPPFPGLCLYYPGRRNIPARLRALIDLICERRNTDRRAGRGTPRAARRDLR